MIENNESKKEGEDIDNFNLVQMNKTLKEQNRGLETILDELVKRRDQLYELNKESGLLGKVNKMKLEIKEFGWSGIVQKYHPDINTEDKGAHELFIFYKFLYEDMVKKNEI